MSLRVGCKQLQIKVVSMATLQTDDVKTMSVYLWSCNKRPGDFEPFLISIIMSVDIIKTKVWNQLKSFTDRSMFLNRRYF